MSKNRFTPFFHPYDGAKRVYVSGPMTGYKDQNEIAFRDATEALQLDGYMVCNPHETSDLLGELSHAQYLRFDFERVLEADFLVALPGWEKSMGALAEILMAIRIGVKVWRWETFSQYNLITYGHVIAAMAPNSIPTHIITRDGEKQPIGST